MSTSFKVLSYDLPTGVFGVAVNFEGTVSHVLGPFPDRRKARKEITEHVENVLGGTIVKAIRQGKDIEHIKTRLEAAWP